MIIQAIEPKLMIDPRPAAIIPGAAAWAAKKECRRFTPIDHSQISGVISS